VLPESLLDTEDDEEDEHEREDESEDDDELITSSRARFLRHAASCVLSAPLLLTPLPQRRQFP
jgi:hypothetical protein